MKIKRDYTLKDYQEMSKRFNKFTFDKKIKALKDNSHIIALGNDNNHFNVQALNKDVQEVLYDTQTGFEIDNEWDYKECILLLEMLGIKIIDY